MNNDEKNYFADGGFILGEVKEEDKTKKKKKKRKKDKAVEEPKPEENVITEPKEETPVVEEPVVEEEIKEEPKEEVKEEEVTPEEKAERKHKGGFAFAVVGIVIILIGLIGIIGILTNGEFREMLSSKTTESTTTSKSTTTTTTTTTKYVDPSTIVEKITYSSITGSKMFFVKINDEYKTTFYQEEGTKYGEYTCKTANCMIFGVSNTGKYSVIYDDTKYFLYDVINSKEVKELNLPMRNYSEIEIFDNDDAIGLIIKLRKGAGTGYFDAKNNKLVHNFLEYNFITSSNFLFSKGYLFLYSFKNRKYYLYDANNNAVKKEDISHIITSKTSNDYYFDNVDLYGSGTSASKVYDKDLNIIYEGSGVPVNNIIFENDELFMYDSRNSYLFKHYKQVKKSINYGKILQANRKYLVVNKNMKLCVVDSEDNVLGTLMDYKNTLSIKELVVNDSDITFSVQDSDYDCKTITEDKSKEVAEKGNSSESPSAETIKSKCMNKKLGIYFEGKFDRLTNTSEVTVVLK